MEAIGKLKGTITWVRTAKALPTRDKAEIEEGRKARAGAPSVMKQTGRRREFNRMLR
jgi:hypothetical protein